jgi:uncharacterized protein YqeY
MLAQYGPRMLVDRMRADLIRAMKTRDKESVNVLRTTLAAISNAEAPPATPAVTQVVGSPDLAGPDERDRLVLTDDDIARIVSDEIADREHTIDALSRGGAADEVTALEAELAILRAYL